MPCEGKQNPPLNTGLPQRNNSNITNTQNKPGRAGNVNRCEFFTSGHGYIPVQYRLSYLPRPYLPVSGKSLSIVTAIINAAPDSINPGESSCNRPYCLFYLQRHPSQNSRRYINYVTFLQKNIFTRITMSHQTV